MAPAVKRLLPPASSSGARSSTSTDTPCSAAESAAHSAALPPPTITTSAEAGSMSVELLFCSRRTLHESGPPHPEGASAGEPCPRADWGAILAKLELEEEKNNVCPRH